MKNISWWVLVIQWFVLGAQVAICWATIRAIDKGVEKLKNLSDELGE